jgi:hypothetical protein
VLFAEKKFSHFFAFSVPERIGFGSMQKLGIVIIPNLYNNRIETVYGTFMNFIETSKTFWKLLSYNFLETFRIFCNRLK